MAPITHSLNNGYTGLKTSQVGISTVGHNISNAENEGYTRQRAVITNNLPLKTTDHAGNLGSGSKISEIVRIHDSFIYSRYKETAGEKENSDYLRDIMEEVSIYFPEIDNVGVKNDLHNYFNSWSAMAQNPNSSAVKIDLAQATHTLTQNIRDVRNKIYNLQVDVNNELLTSIDELNKLGERIANVNRAIIEAEAGGINRANDLRDERGKLEMALAKLVNINVSVKGVESNMQVNRNIKTRVTEGNYNINIGGTSFVDGSTFHPIVLENDDNIHKFYTPYYERQDGFKIKFNDSLEGGKIGAILELRGNDFNLEKTAFEDGTLQRTLDNLDAFTRALIESTNAIYSSSAVNHMKSDEMDIDETLSLVDGEYGIREGSFDLIMYDVLGEEVARKTIYIDEFNNISKGENSILEQINEESDDNKDNNSTNDINDKFFAGFIDGVFQINTKLGTESEGYKIAVKDNGSNFSGVLGLNRFFEGNNASNIKLREEFALEPSLIKAYGQPNEGNNDVANDMLELQFKNLNFRLGENDVNETISSFYDYIASELASKTNSIISKNETVTARNAAVRDEYESVSKVNIDEELAQLIRYQTSYGASAKVVSTVDRMINTLLGIKE